MVAIDTNTNKILAVGEEARRMLGRTPGNCGYKTLERWSYIRF